MLVFNAVLAAALLSQAVGLNPIYFLAGQRLPALLLSAAFSGLLPVPISAPNLTIFLLELVPKEK